jgi:hypothetical protein
MKIPLHAGGIRYPESSGVFRPPFRTSPRAGMIDSFFRFSPRPPWLKRFFVVFIVFVVVEKISALRLSPWLAAFMSLSPRLSAHSVAKGKRTAIGSWK